MVLQSRFPKAFISSTVKDLEKFRSIAEEVANRARFTPIFQKYFTASGRPPLEECIVKVDECDLLIVIIAHRYGWIPNRQNNKSITRLECERAINSNKEILAFIIDPIADWPEEYKEENRIIQAIRKGIATNEMLQEVTDAVTGLKEFKSWIEGKYVRISFRNIDDFGVPLFQALIEWKNRHRAKFPIEYASVDPVLPNPELYFEWVANNYSHLDTERLHGKGQICPLSLPEIFIPLYAEFRLENQNNSNFEESLIDEPPSEHVEFTKILDHSKRQIDIEELIADNQILLIEGEPGTGKTTLLKHVAYNLSQKEARTYQSGKLNGFLPVFISLSELHKFFSSSTEKLSSIPLAEQMLRWLLKNRIGKVLNFRTLQAFIEARKTIFLLDGLDEIGFHNRNKLTSSLCDLAFARKCRLIATSRPYGISDIVSQRFIKNHIRIMNLQKEQVRLFIKKWFQYFFKEKIAIGVTRSNQMIAEIESNPNTEILTVTPLMLTAICILYNDGKGLPWQRADLYKKLCNNLIFRRFREPEQVASFLKVLAFNMHTSRLIAVDRSFAIRALGFIYPQRENEDSSNYNRRLGQYFDEIEPKCGLLQLKNGQYSFRHLTFQEFLSADYLIDNNSNHIEAIKYYWGDSWYKEVILLYIAYLSIEHRKTANDIVEYALDFEDEAPYKVWRTGASALLDIHKERRDSKVTTKAQSRLLEIIRDHPSPQVLVDAGEILGWLGDPRELINFVNIHGGVFSLPGLDQVKIDDFEILRYPVTNLQFASFVEHGGYNKLDYWSIEGWKWLKYHKISHPLFWHDKKRSCPNLPVTGVSNYEAWAFTRWLTKSKDGDYVYRLPSEAEWFVAASGTEFREFPWGNDWDKYKCNSRETMTNCSSAVGVFVDDKTDDGIYDLGGNVREWVGKEYVFILKGGSWFDYSTVMSRCNYRLYCHPGRRKDYIGFRYIRTTK